MEQNTLDSAENSLTDADIQEFIEIYKKEFKESLSFKDARDMATRVLELYVVLATPLPDETHPHPDQEISNGNRVRFPSPSLTKVIDIMCTTKPEI
jgi:hypothetical protein